MSKPRVSQRDLNKFRFEAESSFVRLGLMGQASVLRDRIAMVRSWGDVEFPGNLSERYRLECGELWFRGTSDTFDGALTRMTISKAMRVLADLWEIYEYNYNFEYRGSDDQATDDQVER